MSLAIVNRSFWPESEVLGEALLRLAEKTSETETTCAIFQSSSDCAEKMKKARRGKGVKLRPCRRFTDSSSNVVMRVIETLYFMAWVFFSLIAERPKKVYVSTDPPVLVPYIVFVYAKLFKAEYFYHLQDIHPETTNIVIPVNRYALSFFRYIDNVTIRNAKCVITISEEMEMFIRGRSETKAPIVLLDNPALQSNLTKKPSKNKDFVFGGNFGRLQRIPLLISGISRYLDEGGSSKFTLFGGGVYSPEIQELAEKFEAVEYLGKVSAKEAAEITSKHRWAILPIKDEITKLGFPSKSSSYVFSGCNILAVCGVDTSVSRWVKKNNLGLVIEPLEDNLVACFFKLETEIWPTLSASPELWERLDISYFVNRLIQTCDIAVD